MINYNQEARLGLQTGINKLVEAVAVTLGPKGRNVVIEGGHITKDGVTVAKSINLKDKLENLGAQLIKDVAIKTCDDVGDATTTSSILAQYIINEGIKNIAAGADPLEIKKGIDTGTKKIVDYINKKSIKIENLENIIAIASISANNDEIIGNLIGEAISQVGLNGLVSIEESSTNKTYVEVVKGTQYDRGYLSPYFVTNNEEMIVEYENPIIILYQDKITNLIPFQSILEKALKELTPIILIVDDIDSQMLDTLVVNKLNRGLKICVINSPSFGDKRKKLLNDLSLMLGCNNGIGSCEKIIISKDKTTIINGKGKVPKEYIESTKDDLERYTKLNGSVSIIYVGGNSELEMKEKKDRVDDALCATKAAIEEGIVPGGGSTYIHALKEVNSDNLGETILFNAITYPLKIITKNAGYSPDVIYETIKSKNYPIGYNAKTNKIVDMLNENIIDPAKVVRVALENAASIAGMILTTECVILND